MQFMKVQYLQAKREALLARYGRWSAASFEGFVTLYLHSNSHSNGSLN